MTTPLRQGGALPSARPGGSGRRRYWGVWSYCDLPQSGVRFQHCDAPTTVIPAKVGIYACRLHYGSRLRRWIPAEAGMAANMTTRPGLKQGKQSLGRTRFKSGGAGKAVFAVGPAGRVGPAAILGLSKGSKASRIPALSRVVRANRFLPSARTGGSGRRRYGMGRDFTLDSPFGTGAMRLISGVRFGFVRFGGVRRSKVVA